ncbi:MAG: pentapeptide repeat-containing protein, partial [Kovacikia sp.]
FSTSEAEGGVIVDHYAGNPLALKLAAASIRDLLHGNVSEFLSLMQQGRLLFGDIQDLLRRHFNRLSSLEQEVMYWLAIAREAISLEELKTDLLLSTSRLKLAETLDSLNRRSLLEISSTGFTLQPAVMEYITNRLIENVLREILQSHEKEGLGKVKGEIDTGIPGDGEAERPLQNSEPSPIPYLKNYALIKATAKDYIREAQTRLLLGPLVEQLRAVFDTSEDIKVALMQILSTLQGKPPLKTGYIGGNIFNLLCYFQVDLSDFDFSHLTLWQADLRQVTLHRVNFTQADLSRSAFTDTFGNVLSVAFSPDGSILAKSDEQGWISLWQVETSKQLLAFKAHSNWVFSVAFSPDGKTLASGGLDRTVKLWNLGTGECLKTFQLHEGGVSAVAYVPIAPTSPDMPSAIGRNTLVSSSADQTIKLMDLQTDECQLTLVGHQGIIRSIALSPNSQTLASASMDHTIKLWNIQTGECLKTLEDSAAIYSVTFVPRDREGREQEDRENGKDPQASSPPPLLASAGDDGTVKLWDTTTGECIQVLAGHGDRIWSLAASQTGKILVSGSDDKTVKIWDVDTGQCLKTLQGHQNRIWSVALSPDGQILASGSNDRTLRLWNIGSGQCLRVFQGYDNCTLPIVFWEHPDLQTEGREPKAEASEQSLPSPPAAQPFLLTFSADQVVRLWDLQTNQCLKAIPLPTKAAMQAALSPDGKILAGGSLDHTIRLCDVNSGSCLKTLKGHTAWVRTVVFSPNSTLLASASGDQTVKLWQVDSGQCLRTLIGHTNPIQSIAFSPDGQTLASGSWDWTIKLWDVNSGNCLNTLRGHTDQLREIRFSPNGQTLVSSSLDQSIRLWEVATGQAIKTLDAHAAEVEAIACSPNGQLLASASQDGTIRLWHLPSGESLYVLTVQTGYSGALVFSADSHILAIGGEDGTCTLWDVREIHPPSPRDGETAPRQISNLKPHNSFPPTACSLPTLSVEPLQTLQVPRPYEGMNITHIQGLTEAQKSSLCALGAFMEIDK